MSLTKVTYSMIAGAPANVKDFGAVGDGVSDDTAAIQLALDSGSSTVFFPAGEYVISSQLQVPNYVTVCGEGEASYINGNAITAGTSGSPKAVFIPKAKINSAYATNPVLTAQANQNASTLAVDQTTNVAVGDIIALGNNVTYNFLTPNLEGDPGQQVEFFNVVGKTGTSIVLDRPVAFTYKTAGPAASIANFVRFEGIVIQDLKITTNALYVYAFTADALYKCALRRLSINTNGLSRAVQVTQAVDLEISGCITDNTADSAALWIAYWSTRCRIVNNICKRHDVAGSGDANIILYFGCNNNVVASNNIEGVIQAPIYGIAIHTKSYGNTVTGNTINGMQFGIGAVFGSFGNTIDGNAITACHRGVTYSQVRDMTCTGNSIKACGTTGDATTGGVTVAEAYDSNFSGNNISDCLADGFNIYSSASARLTVTGNSVARCTGAGVYFQIACPDSTIVGNTFYKCSSGVLTAADTARVIIMGNVVNSCTSHGLFLSITGEQTRVIGNTCRSNGGDGIKYGTGANAGENYVVNNVCTGNTGYGLNLTATNIVSASANTLSGNTAGRMNNGLTSVPNSSLLADTNYMVFNEPANPTVAKTVLGWRRKDSTTPFAAGWIQVNVSET